MSNTALNLLADAADVMRKRGVDRDSPEGERTMGKIVGAFNAATGHKLSDRDGWLFMVFLKAIRAAATPTGKLDDYVDGAAYFALAGEAAHDASRVGRPLNGTIVPVDDFGHVINSLMLGDGR
jgi:hypothetical protein